MKPTDRPLSPCFSSGPCAKRPGWSPDVLAGACLGRSHRSKDGMAKIDEVIARTRNLLGLPEDYRVAIVPASDTGAVEMAMWTMLGARGVDVLAWESFGQGWITDVVEQLEIGDVRLIEADYGKLPDLGRVDPARDLVFTWNGTTSGVCVPNADWIAAEREGITICDATSAIFAMPLEWPKLDVTTYSWQKVLGGEAAHGMLILSPRAVERLESYSPPWPLPKIFRLTKGGKLSEGIFQGQTINTPSMLCVEDAIDALRWAEQLGGLDGLIGRSRANLAVVERWVQGTDWIDFLPEDPAARSSTSISLKMVDAWFTAMEHERRFAFTRSVTALLESEGVAYDIASHRDSPPGYRIWGGATVEAADIEAMLPWLEWAYAERKAATLAET